MIRKKIAEKRVHPPPPSKSARKLRCDIPVRSYLSHYSQYIDCYTGGGGGGASAAQII